MRCTQQDKGQGQGQGQGQVQVQGQGQGQGPGQGQDSKVPKLDWESMEAPLASHTHLHPLTIPTDTHNGCRLMCEEVIHMLLDLLFAAAVCITHKHKNIFEISKDSHLSVH